MVSHRRMDDGRVPYRALDTSVLLHVMQAQDEIGRRIQDRDNKHHTGGEKFLARVARITEGWD